jgi:Family of unknown function (DUF6011)
VTKQASPKQYGFIRRLVEERISQFPEGLDAFMTTIQNKRLTGQGASRAIDALLAMPADAKPAVGNRDVSRRSNRYPGRCIKCGHEVAANAGYLTGGPGNWGAEHLDGECLTGEVKPKTHELTEIVGDLEDGNYAVPATSGETDVWYFSIATNKGFYNPDKKGQRIVRMVAGGGNDFRVSNDWVRKAVAMVRSMGAIASMQMFAREMKICGRCGEDLSRADSKVTGFGPTCRGKIGYVISPEERAEIKRLIAEAKARGEELV